MKFDCVIFDFDGTLADSSEGIMSSVEYALKKLELPVPDRTVMRSFIGPSVFYSFSTVLGLDEETAWRAVTAYREYYRPHGVFGCKLYPGMKELLCSLAEANITLAVASAKPQPLLEVACNHLGIADKFATIAGSYLDTKNNDKAWIVERAKSGSRPVMVGDTPFDICAAHAAGTASIAVGYGFGKREALEAEKPDYFAADMAQLKEILLEK